MAKPSEVQPIRQIHGLRLGTDGVFRYRFVHAGKLHQGSTGTVDSQAAAEFLAQLRTRLESQSLTVTPKAAPTFKDAYQLWMKVMGPRVSTKTIQMMESHWRRAWINWAETPLDQLQPMLDSHYNECRTRFAVSTLAVRFIRLGTILKFARDRGLHSIRFSLPRIKVPRKPKLVLTEEQVGEFFRHLDTHATLHQSVMVRAMYYLGMREQEAYRLKFSNWNEKDRTYTIDQQKNGEISILPVVEEMAGWFDRLPRQRIYMCPRANSDHPHGEKYTTKVVKRAAAEMGLPRDFCHHALRRSLATVLIRRGVPLVMVQKILRHSSPEITAACYVEADIQDMRSALGMLGCE